MEVSRLSLRLPENNHGQVHVPLTSAVSPYRRTLTSFELGRAAYSDGVMIPVKAGTKDSFAIPCAGNDGTLIVVSPVANRALHTADFLGSQVEDLFFNTPTRLKSLRSSSDEYSRIVAVVLHYSIHNAGVSMVCKKANASTADVNTAVGASVNDNIGIHYGEAVRKELVELQVDSLELGVKVKGWVSGANYGAKKGTYLFFINRESFKLFSMHFC